MTRRPCKCCQMVKQFVTTHENCFSCRVVLNGRKAYAKRRKR